MLTGHLGRAGLVLGLGIGGFIDGIVFHQILQWHHLVCETSTCRPQSVAALQRQTVQDGFFHLATLALTILGVFILFRAGRERAAEWSGRVLFGAILAGWGAFNFVEGLVDHEALGIHHVWPGSPHQFLADMTFLASGLVLLAAGGWMAGGPARTPAIEPA